MPSLWRLISRERESCQQPYSVSGTPFDSICVKQILSEDTLNGSNYDIISFVNLIGMCIFLRKLDVDPTQLSLARYYHHIAMY